MKEKSVILHWIMELQDNNEELYLYIFKKSLDEWVLENQEYMNSENFEQNHYLKIKI